MLGRAEEVSDMIEIEQRLGEVRFQIESLVSTLRNWENRIRFSTLHLNIHEVHEYTEVEERNVPYWRQVWNGLMNTFRNIGQFFMNLLMWIIVNLPTLIILAVVALATLLITRRVVRNHKKKRTQARQAYYANNMATPNSMSNQGYINTPNNINVPDNTADTSDSGNTGNEDNNKTDSQV
jgi:hypothetical protein